MTKCNLATLDGAELIIVEQTGFSELLVAWFGGTTFNVYAKTNDGEYPLDERTVFSLSDENGEPVDRETAKEHAREWLQKTIEEQK